MTDAEFSSRLSNCALGDERGTFAAGTVFGEWRITAFIAKGGTAEVYCAEHATVGTPAAVKVLSEPLTDSRKARFLREARLLAELKSPSFPTFHGCGEANGRPYLVEELLEPGDLPTGDGPRAKFLLALCAGLRTLHARGIVHRDLKPANILFRKNGAPVIVDLGLAKSVDTPIVPDGVSIVDGKAVGVGTPEYAAPEQFTGGGITPAADIHALGVLTKKLAALYPSRSRRCGEAPVAVCWRNIIRRATSSIASERYQSVDEFTAAIRRRHWLRNGIVLCLSGLCVAGLVTAHALQSRTKADSLAMSQSWGRSIAVGSAPRADRNAELVPTQCHSIAARAGREPYPIGYSGCGDAEVAAHHPQPCDNTDSFQVQYQKQPQNPTGQPTRERPDVPPRQEMYDIEQKSLQTDGKSVRWPETPRPPQGADDPFTALFRDEGRDAQGRKVYGLDLACKNHSASPTARVTLRGPAVYRITGPGALMANIDGEGDVEIELRHQANLINFTRVPLKDSSVKYALKDESRLTLWCLRKEDAPDKLLCDPDFNVVDFMGAE